MDRWVDRSIILECDHSKAKDSFLQDNCKQEGILHSISLDIPVGYEGIQETNKFSQNVDSSRRMSEKDV